MQASWSLLRYQAPLTRVTGATLEADLPDVAIGEICLLRAGVDDPQIRGKALVIGLRDGMAILSLLGKADGLSRRWRLEPTGQAAGVWLSAGLSGAVLDASGQVLLRLLPAQCTGPAAWWPLTADPPLLAVRRSVSQRLETGVRAVDALLSCGLGQRMGIFAQAGCGKTSLLLMILASTTVDMVVLALIGERSRELRETIDALQGQAAASRVVVVVATADQPPAERVQAAQLASTVAEYFRQQGKSVLLLFDSVTRYARALRDLALAMGEWPARRGYPASVFSALPVLLERAGNTDKGSISAFYTVLLEDDDEPDPVAEEIRSILDGHIVLRRHLAGAGHFPAIDVLASASRLFTRLADARQHQAVTALRQVLNQLQSMQMMIELGEYRPGVDAQQDRAMRLREAVQDFLRQPAGQSCTWDDSLAQLYALFDAA